MGVDGELGLIDGTFDVTAQIDRGLERRRTSSPRFAEAARWRMARWPSHPERLETGGQALQVGRIFSALIPSCVSTVASIGPSADSR